MPDKRPAVITCYYNRDEEYVTHAGKLARGIVLNLVVDFAGELGFDEVAGYIAVSNLLSASSVQVGRLSKGRYLAVLPLGVERDKVAKAIPRWVWDKGITLHSYSPLMNVEIAISFFRVWLDLEGIPLELWREGDVVRAVSGFGMYLGSLEPVMGDNYTT
jgi:hypothetical protein